MSVSVASQPSKMQTSSSRLLNLPNEIADRIYTYSVSNDPSTVVPLLLTSKTTNALVTYRADRLVREEVARRPFFYSFFGPRANENLLGSWIPRLTAKHDGCCIIGVLAEEHALSGAMDQVDEDGVIDEFCRMLRMGLYLVEMLQCGATSGRQEPAVVDRYLKALPLEAVVLIRFISIVLMTLLDSTYDFALEGDGSNEGDFITPVSHFPDFAMAVEVKLLTRGCGSFAEMFRPVVSDLVLNRLTGKEVEVLETYDRDVYRQRTEEVEKLIDETEIMRLVERTPGTQASAYDGRTSYRLMEERLRADYVDYFLDFDDAVDQIVSLVVFLELEIGEKEDKKVLIEWKKAAGIS